MPSINNQEYLRNQQYKDASNLNARVRLHACFSTNPYDWFLWVFDQYDLPAGARILELGCGTAVIWCKNHARIPSGWEIVLTDFSPGMLEQARLNTTQTRPLSLLAIDAQALAFDDQSFDAVIANHMLYHVPDRPRALGEIRRVLKPGGKLYATTIGETHLQELLALPGRFAPGRTSDPLQFAHEFSLESGAAQLYSHFNSVERRRYPDALHVTEAAPLVDFILSSFQFDLADARMELLRFVEQELAQNGGALDITKDSGIFIAA